MQRKNATEDRIRVQGIEFYGFHGCSAAEQQVGHRYVVDLEIALDLRSAGSSDDLARTLDYGEAIAVVLEVGQGTAVRLMETLAHRIGCMLLERFDAAHSVRVTVAKRLPPVPAVAELAGVEVVRTREDL